MLQNRLKILGKIDLDAGKPKSKQEPATELPVAPVVVETPPPPPPKPEVNEVADLPAIKEEAPVVVLPPVVEVAPPPPAPPVEEVKPVQLPVIEKKPVEPAPAPVQEVAPPQEAGNVESEDAVIRAEAPELRGLKIMGKIDTSKFQPEKKKKKGKEPERKPASPATPASATPTTDDKTKKAAPAAANDDAARKRKRKRKKVATEPSGQDASRQQQQQPGARRKDGSAPPSGPEVKEVSQKEIEDKIKATIARLSGGGKKKRQKLQRDKRERMRERQEMADMENETGKLQVTEFVTVSELASLMNVSPAEVIMTCLNVGVVVGINQRLDAEVIDLVATEFGFEIEFIGAEATLETEDEEEDDPADLVPLAPIVTVMGHVDHGKTSLLDHIRKSNVVEGEAGGITQHIGAYEVDLGSGKKVTFLDTPGHEAFTAMRARGTKVTDIAVIVVAADDSIMPQTREAISHAQAAGVPIVFAINKIDKDGANPERIKQELASMDFLVEEWGGKYQSQDISAKHGTGMDMLLEKILLEAEIQELKANPGRKATGTVIEASLDKGRGYVSKLLVQNGTLNVGSAIVAGEH
ncbi:MAG TPA: translation initiation factor IF-2 N-terminal domain-containing protein, partial [Saprospiraceae bacterium]|nr:translation initiation factor IF-2 N-terminal domain-containing protein [Saprospiraceae bacterium]